MQTGPIGSTVSIPLLFRGIPLGGTRRYAVEKRLVYQQLLLDTCGVRLEKKTRHTPCNQLLTYDSAPDLEGVLAGAEEQGKQALNLLFSGLQANLREAQQQIPTKLVCGNCHADVREEDCDTPYYCSSCEEFRVEACLGYENDGADVVLSHEDVKLLNDLRLKRSLNMYGVLDRDIVLEGWETNELFGLYPDEGSEAMIDAWRNALFAWQRPMLALYCSANEKKQITLKNEWVALVMPIMKGTGLVVATLRPARDVQVNPREVTSVSASKTAQAVTALLPKAIISKEDWDAGNLETPARSMLHARLSGNAWKQGNPLFDRPPIAGLEEEIEAMRATAEQEAEEQAAEMLELAKEREAAIQAELDSTPDETDEEEPLEEETEVSQSEDEG